jgi:hypothetical protein
VLSRIVASKLREDWSPEQIAGWLKLEFPQDETMRVSHETIYLTLFGAGARQECASLDTEQRPAMLTVSVQGYDIADV